MKFLHLNLLGLRVRVRDRAKVRANSNSKCLFLAKGCIVQFYRTLYVLRVPLIYNALISGAFDVDLLIQIQVFPYETTVNKITMKTFLVIFYYQRVLY